MSVRRLLVRGCGVGLVAIALAGCGSGGGTEQPDPFGEPRVSGIDVEVENLNFDRATIWAESNAGRRRLGVVEGKTSETFTLSNWPVSAPIYLEVHLTGGGTCRTSELIADPGDVLYLQVASSGVTGNCG